MSSPIVTYEVRGPAALVTLNRPQKRNALSHALIDALEEALRQAVDDPTARLVVLAGAGPVFCAGMDLTEMLEAGDDADSEKRWLADARRYRDLLMQIYNLPKPTLAAVDGPALAGGAGLVLACDMAVGSDRATFGLPEVRRGIVAAIVAPFLVMRTAAGAASQLLLTGETIPAADAQRLGIFSEVVPHDKLAGRVAEIGDSVARCAPGALAETKRVLHDIAGDRLAEQLDAAARISAAARGSDEATEGLRAFLEKREPRWAPGGDAAPD